MRFGLIGINYTQAPLDIRDKASFTDSKKMEFLEGLQNSTQPAVAQCMIISTCNRCEIFFCYAEDSQFAQMRSYYLHWFREAHCGPYLVTLQDDAAITYLYKVAAGLESLVLGEDQILGQVMDALDFSKAAGFGGKELNKIVRDAITCAKRLKTQLKISEIPLSVSYIGIQQLEKRMGIQGKNVLIIGSGKVSQLTIKYLEYYQAAAVYLCNRTKERAFDIQKEHPLVQVIAYEDRYTILKDVDIVIGATSAPHTVLTLPQYRKACGNDGRRRLLLDLAAPRDIDRAFESEPGVELINLDVLSQIASENQEERQRLVEIGKGQMEADIAQTVSWLFSCRMDPTIESLQKRCSEIVEDSFCYLNRKIDLNPHEQMLLKKMLAASLQRLLREPIAQMKALGSEPEQETCQQFVRQLFQL